MQTGFRYALDEGYEIAVRLDGDGQHDASELGKLLGPIHARRRRTSSSARASSIRAGTYRPPFARRLGIRRVRAARLAPRRAAGHRHDVRASSRSTARGIELFAVEYPHDYPEVEATLVALRSGLRLAQVQVEMRERETGSVVDHVRPVALLHRQGHARAARREPSPLPAPRGARSDDADSRVDRRRGRLDHPHPRRRSSSSAGGG